MSIKALEERVNALETEVKQLKQRNGSKKFQEPRGWQRIVGVFADDPEFEEAMRLGREYRESLRPENDEAA